METMIVVLMLPVVVLWIVMPFVVFGIRNRLDTLILEVQRVAYAIKIAHDLRDVKDAQGNAALARPT